MKTKLFPIAIALFFVSASLRADVLPGNFWHNPTFEASSNSIAPNFWQSGGNDPSANQWSTANSVSATHSLAQIDSSLGNGEWYSDLPLVGLASSGQTIGLHWHEIYNVINGPAPGGDEMRVTVRFLDAGGAGPDNHFVVTGNSSGWGGTVGSSTFSLRNETLVVRTPDVAFPNPVTTLRIQLASGGAGDVTGSFLIDDLSVTVVPEPSTIALLCVGGLVGLSVLIRRRKIAR